MPRAERSESPPSGKLWAAYKTAKCFLKSSLDYNPSTDPLLAASQARVALMGSQLSSTDVINFVENFILMLNLSPLYLP